MLRRGVRTFSVAAVAAASVLGGGACASNSDDGVTAGTGGGGGAAGGGSGPLGPPTPDEVARAAVIIGSCHPDNGVNRETGFIWRDFGLAADTTDLAQQAKCIASAGGGCGALKTCLGWNVSSSPGCSEGVTCSGSKFTLCMAEIGITYSIDCQTMGLACNADPKIDDVASSRRACLRGANETCDSSLGFQATCNGSVPQVCDDSRWYHGPDCAARDLACAEGLCTGTGDACTAPIGCSGDVLLDCANRRRHDVDCTQYGAGFSCRSFGGAFFCGLGAECLPSGVAVDDTIYGDPEPACDGTAIVFCNAGRLERIDCASLGFTGCDLDGGLGCVPSPVSELAARGN
jgi:hypothetical protein